MLPFRRIHAVPQEHLVEDAVGVADSRKWHAPGNRLSAVALEDRLHLLLAQLYIQAFDGFAGEGRERRLHGGLGSEAGSASQHVARSCLPDCRQALRADLTRWCAAVDPTPQGIGQALGGCRIASRALPEIKYPPAHLRELAGDTSVAINVALQLGGPELGPRRWRLGEFASLVGMPETTVDEDRDPATRYGDVGCTW